MVSIYLPSLEHNLIGTLTDFIDRYKAFIRAIDAPLYAEFQFDESKSLNIPSVVVTAKHDYDSRPEFQIPAAQKYLSNKPVEQLDCGHWIPLKKPMELVSLIDNFIGQI